MPGAMNASVLAAIGEVSPAEWDACADDGNPFVSHAFLSALEGSDSATAATGWTPHHLVVRDATGQVAGVAPLYLKSHSYGEYVFDWGWAEAWQRAGGRYYPKLQSSIPFTPVTGPRLMARNPEASRALIATLLKLAERRGVSSLHVTFPLASEAEALERAGFLLRQGFQYHWRNRDYASFDDFLADLSSRKRKQIRHERAAVAASGLTLSTLVGDDIKPRHWDAFHRLYQMTVDRKWGGAYLTREFFERLSASTLGERVVLITALDDDVPVAAAFNMVGGDTLFGRNWGTASLVPFLHFEACYYRAIDFAIAHRLARVEAGAQGEHKVSRGYLPSATWSAHWIADSGFRRAVGDFLARERPMIEAEMRTQTEAGPFRRLADGAQESGALECSRD